MKTVIYYFTGTGNSLAVAKKIAAALGDCELVSIASQKDIPGTIVPAADRVGIVCPVYFSGLPLMIADFAARLDCSRTRYTFGVVTFGGSGSAPTLRQLDGLLRKTHDRGLDAGFSVKMPGNYIFMYGSPAGEKQVRILESANNQIAEIIPFIERSEHRNLPRSIISWLLHAVAYPWFTAHAGTEDKKFSVTDACTSCGTCAKVCPAGNIELVNGKPVWHHHCEVCCGCIHICPAQAIQAGSKTAGRQRYRNPSVSIADLKIPDMKTRRGE
jgi:Pyruvate/2-oxoacid:ferredoxin oxidoreductase delta subunit